MHRSEGDSPERRATSEAERNDQLLAAGIDSLYLSCFYDGLGVDWEWLRFEKEKLRHARGAEYAEITFGGERFALRRGGRHRYTFVLANEAFELCLAERMSPRCYAKVSSHLLWTAGLDAAIDRLETIWRKVGSRATRPMTVSRVDAAFDFKVANPSFHIEHFVSQAAKDAQWRQDQSVQSFQIGTSDVVCRFYDKVAEIEQQSGKAWLFDIWGTREGVWRAEFQIRGGRLHDFGIATLEQLRAYLPGAVKHLARHHTSLRTPGKDTNRSRWPLHPIWRGLIESVDQLTPPSGERVPPPLMTGCEYQLARQIQSLYGDLKGVAATLTHSGGHSAPPTLEELFHRLPRLLSPYHHPDLWRADVAAKARKRELGL